MVFDALAAPRSRQAFMAWHGAQTQWMDLHSSDDPDILTPALRAWLQEIIKTFPPMNGPSASDDYNDARVTDYSLGRSMIYAAFAWSQADDAHALAKALAAKHGVGFFDVSSTAGDIWLPTPDQRLEKLLE